MTILLTFQSAANKVSLWWSWRDLLVIAAAFAAVAADAYALCTGTLFIVHWDADR